MAAHECYIAMLEMDNHFQALTNEERKVIVEPTEDLEEVSLDDNTPGRTTRVDTQANPSVRKELAPFLKRNQDFFAWSHKDMLGISPSTMVHKLNVCLSFLPIRQKRGFSPKKGTKL